MAKILQTLNALDPRRRTEELSGFRAFLYGTANVLLLVCVGGAAAGLTALYGFHLSEQSYRTAMELSQWIMAGFALQALLKLTVIHQRQEFLRRRWAEYLMVFLILSTLLFPGRVEGVMLMIDPRLTPVTLTSLYFALSQLLVLVALIPSSLRASRSIMTRNVQPSMLLLASFLLLIAAGTALLLLPRATVPAGMPFVDALFTATSAVCVTGLIVVDTNRFFTPLGHDILLLLIQVGGLGIMTFTTFFAYVLGGSGSLKEYSTMQSLLGEEGVGRIKRTLAVIAMVTLVIEAGGALLLYAAIGGAAIEGYDPWYFSIFHSVSAFCNAGFTLTTENLMHPQLRTNTGVLNIVAVLVVLGGLGFPVFNDLLKRLWRVLRRSPAQVRFTVHTKLVLVVSSLLVVAGTAGLFLIEQGQTMHGGSAMEWQHAFLQSVIARTAGFNSVDITALTVPSLFLLILLMWIGASPASTGGGIKTTTFAVALLNLRTILTGRKDVEVFDRRIPAHVSMKAFSTVLLSLFIMAAALFALLLTEQHPFELLLFEVVSAMSTVGLSAGITPQLSTPGKYIIIAVMIAGRIGFLAFLMALVPRRKRTDYEHLTEEVLIT